MKRLSLAIVCACCTLAVAAQEEGFRVNYQGAKPTIKNFAKAYITSLLNPEDEEPEGDGLYMYESIQKAMICKEKGQPLEKNETLTIDLKNGFLVYEETDDYYVYRIEMCYWNEADHAPLLFYPSSPARDRGESGPANLENDTEKKRANIKERLAKIPKSLASKDV